MLHCWYVCLWTRFAIEIVYLFFFFFKQKTAYEMRISDWSSDVCSSDLEDDGVAEGERGRRLPRRDGDREIPRRNQSECAHRLAIGRGIDAGARRFEGQAVTAQRLAGEIAKDARGAQHLARRQIGRAHV